MDWQTPKDGAELSQALAINIGALGALYLLFVLGLYGIAPEKFAGLHEWITNSGIPIVDKTPKKLATFLLDTPYCLDAVVRRYRQRARQLFDSASEVESRSEWVPAPLMLGDELIKDYEAPVGKSALKPYVAGLQKIKARLGQNDVRWIISIEGSGGAF
jgi:hypothetical protein